MIVDSGVFKKLESQVRRENIRKVRILGGNFYRSLLGNQAGYLRPPEKVDIERCERSLFGNQARYLRSLGRVDIEGRNMNYVSLMFRIKCCSGKLLFNH